MNYEAAFKSIDDTLWKDAGCGSELDYIEQTSWILFLKYLDDLEKENKAAAELNNKTYSPILSNEFSWETWAAPKKADGSNGLWIWKSTSFSNLWQPMKCFVK